MRLQTRSCSLYGHPVMGPGRVCAPMHATRGAQTSSRASDRHTAMPVETLHERRDRQRIQLAYPAP